MTIFYEGQNIYMIFKAENEEKYINLRKLVGFKIEVNPFNSIKRNIAYHPFI